MTKPEISGIAPLFIVNNIPAASAFYRDRLGFDITFQGPEPDDIFFGIVQRGAAMIMFKDVGVDPVPNYTRDVQHYARDEAVHLTSDTRLDIVMDRAKRALHGNVEESSPCVAKPVGGATLRVLDGPDAGMSAITSSLGQYDFQPLRWGMIVLQISKPGYVTAQTTVDLLQYGGGDGTGLFPLTANFRLTPISGTCATTP